MKLHLWLLLFFCVPAKIFAQTSPCCHSDAIKEFSMLAEREDFKMAHENPLPYKYEGMDGTTITFPTPDGKMGYGFLLKAKEPSDKYLFVYQEWWGVNDYIKKQSEKLYNDLNGTVNVLAVDMYDQKVAANREDAAKYMKDASLDRLESIMQGAIKYAGPDAEIASIGWCFGGGLALQSALLEGEHNIGVVMYYGMPEKDVNKLKTLTAPVLGIFGTKDKGINTELVDEFEKNMKEAGKTLMVKRYNADHGFANPSNPDYNVEATEDAYKHAIAFLRKQFE
ncbi:dienelactone hydrolase family protein [Chitinophaga silvatica]|uniref:Dienelactone hydrolase family protein n=1 Tax=Chitinophaga silvatica TaxID=2282649 RepID=A0A3E1YF95_9BACT|nr:dienelactone hydrolase family protein [Chitinophaga silvatica]RFS24987.1 dienelactone hydrolase family protein [Chitinophaga silvatica]